MKKKTYRFYGAVFGLIISSIWVLGVLIYGKNDAGPFIGLIPFYIILPTLFFYGLGSVLDISNKK